MRALSSQPFDCCVVDLRLPDMTGFELIEHMQADPSLRNLPVVVLTRQELTGEEEARLKAAARSVVLKDVQSPERLFDETALFLHRVVAELPEPKRKLLERLYGSNDVLRERNVALSCARRAEKIALGGRVGEYGDITPIYVRLAEAEVKLKQK